MKRSLTKIHKPYNWLLIGKYSPLIILILTMIIFMTTCFEENNLDPISNTGPTKDIKTSVNTSQTLKQTVQISLTVEPMLFLTQIQFDSLSIVANNTTVSLGNITVDLINGQKTIFVPFSQKSHLLANITLPDGEYNELTLFMNGLTLISPNRTIAVEIPNQVQQNGLKVIADGDNLNVSQDYLTRLDIPIGYGDTFNHHNQGLRLKNTIHGETIMPRTVHRSQGADMEFIGKFKVVIPPFSLTTNHKMLHFTADTVPLIDGYSAVLSDLVTCTDDVTFHTYFPAYIVTQFNKQLFTNMNLPSYYIQLYELSSENMLFEEKQGRVLLDTTHGIAAYSINKNVSTVVCVHSPVPIASNMQFDVNQKASLTVLSKPLFNDTIESVEVNVDGTWQTLEKQVEDIDIPGYKNEKWTFEYPAYTTEGINSDRQIRAVINSNGSQRVFASSIVSITGTPVVGTPLILPYIYVNLGLNYWMPTCNNCDMMVSGNWSVGYGRPVLSQLNPQVVNLIKQIKIETFFLPGYYPNHAERYGNSAGNMILYGPGSPINITLPNAQSGKTFVGDWSDNFEKAIYDTVNSTPIQHKVTISILASNNVIYIASLDPIMDDIDNSGTTETLKFWNNSIFVSGHRTAGDDRWYTTRLCANTGQTDNPIPIRHWPQQNNFFAGEDRATDVGVDKQNNVYVVGYFDTPNNNQNWYIRKYDTDGVLITTNTLTNCQKKDAQAYALAIDNNDPSIPFPNISVYVVGYKDQPQDNTWCVMKLDSNLMIGPTALITEIFPLSCARDVVVDANHRVIVVGDESDGISRNWWAEIVAGSNLQKLGATKFQSKEIDYARAVAANTNYIYVGGSTRNNWKIVQLDNNLNQLTEYIGAGSGEDSITGLDLIYNRVAVSGYTNKDTNPTWHIGYIDIVPNSITYNSTHTFINEYSTRICFDTNCEKGNLVYAIGVNNTSGTWIIRKLNFANSTTNWTTALTSVVGTPWGLATSPEKLSYQ